MNFLNPKNKKPEVQVKVEQALTHLQTHLTNLQNQAKQAASNFKLPSPFYANNPKPIWARISTNSPSSSSSSSLSIQDIEERLAGVPVYALSNPSDEFVLVSSGSSGKSLGLFCFKEEDVNTLLDQMKLMDPTMRNGSKVVAVALNKVFQLKVDGVGFRLIPDSTQITNAIAERKRAGSSDGSFSGVPVFQVFQLKVDGVGFRLIPDSTQITNAIAFYTKTGNCKFGASCKFHHPKDIVIPVSGQVNGTGNEEAFKSGSVMPVQPIAAPASLHNSKGLPVRPVFQLKVDGVGFRLIPDSTQITNAIAVVCQERRGFTSYKMHTIMKNTNQVQPEDTIEKERRGFTSYKMHTVMKNTNQVQPEDTIEKECKGIPLMEVFGLLYIGHDPVKAENQFGTIKIISTSGEQYLYEVPEKKIEDVDMTKPTLIYRDDIAVSVKAPTCSFTKLCMDFDLFSGDYKGEIKVNVDWEFIKRCTGQVVCMEKRIISRDHTGEIAVRMGLFANATVARLNITLLNEAAGTDVYGVVVASNSKLDYAPKFASVLFVRKQSDSIQVGENGVIPLSKSLVGVPLDSFLHVDISLIVNGVRRLAGVEFIADTAGKATDFYRDMIKVNVEWDAKEDSVTAEYKTIFDDKQQSEFETLYGLFEDVTDNSDNY